MCRRRLKCSFQRSRQFASVTIRLPLESFTQGCRDAWAITGLAQQAKDTAHMLLLAADSRCLASACQNFSLSSAIATLRWRFSR